MSDEAQTPQQDDSELSDEDLLDLIAQVNHQIFPVEEKARSGADSSDLAVQEGKEPADEAQQSADPDDEQGAASILPAVPEASLDNSEDVEDEMLVDFDDVSFDPEAEFESSLSDDFFGDDDDEVSDFDIEFLDSPESAVADRAGDALEEGAEPDSDQEESDALLEPLAELEEVPESERLVVEGDAEKVEDQSDVLEFLNELETGDDLLAPIAEAEAVPDEEILPLAAAETTEGTDDDTEVSPRDVREFLTDLEIGDDLLAPIAEAEGDQLQDSAATEQAEVVQSHEDSRESQPDVRDFLSDLESGTDLLSPVTAVEEVPAAEAELQLETLDVSEDFSEAEDQSDVLEFLTEVETGDDLLAPIAEVEEVPPDEIQPLMIEDSLDSERSAEEPDVGDTLEFPEFQLTDAGDLPEIEELAAEPDPGDTLEFPEFRLGTKGDLPELEEAGAEPDPGDTLEFPEFRLGGTGDLPEIEEVEAEPDLGDTLEFPEFRLGGTGDLPELEVEEAEPDPGDTLEFPEFRLGGTGDLPELEEEEAEPDPGDTLEFPEFRQAATGDLPGIEEAEAAAEPELDPGSATAVPEIRLDASGELAAVEPATLRDDFSYTGADTEVIPATPAETGTFARTPGLEAEFAGPVGDLTYEAALPVTYRYRISAVLSTEIEIQLNAARENVQIEVAEPGFVALQGNFHCDEVDDLKSVLREWVDSHLPQEFQLERVEAEVVGTQRYRAGWTLTSGDEYVRLQETLSGSLAELISRSDDVEPEMRVHLPVADFVPAEKFPALVQALQLNFEGLYWRLDAIELLQAPEGDDRWEVVEMLQI